MTEGDAVVDATAGNGGDTLWLAKAVGPRGSVFAFDKEENALAGTAARIRANISIENMPSMHFHHCCHSLMQDVVALHSASLICFNLGYLPSAEDKPQTTTEQFSTLAAVAAALNTVNDRGLISIMAYTGHPGGQQEYEAVRQHLQALSPVKWTVSEHRKLSHLISFESDLLLKQHNRPMPLCICLGRCEIRITLCRPYVADEHRGYNTC
ncbi:hypothetical protein WJX82_006665 [Trebouxia sp. C0006]